MKKIFTRLLFIAILLISQISMAVPAYKGLVQLSQPDGTEVSAYLFGDERVNWVESEDNYTLLYNKEGYLEYAIKDQQGDLIPSGIIAKNSNNRSVADLNFLSSIQKQLRYSKNQINIMLEITEMLDNSKAAIEGRTVGIRKLLVILVAYTDIQFTYTRTQFDNLFNQIGYSASGATGSVRDYYLANSYGKFDLQSEIVGPYVLPNNRAFYGRETDLVNDANAKQMIIDACNAANNDVDFSVFDNDGDLTVDGVHIIYAGQGQHNGGGADAIWAHRSRLDPPIILDGVRVREYSCASEKRSYNEMSGIGVHIHEFGHVLGLLDYYDTDYEQNGVSKTLGDLEVMDAGAYNNSEKTPPLYNAYSKIFLGWANPYIIDSNMLMDITSIPTEDTALIFRINTPTEGEYFLLENINFSGWNAYLHYSIINYKNGTGVNSGIRALHVDESENATGWGLFTAGGNCINCVAAKNNVLLMSANGAYNGMESGQTGHRSWNYTEMTNMLYPGSQNITSLTDQTTTNLKSWNNQNSNVALTNITRLSNDNITFKTNEGAAFGVQVQTLAPSQITHTSAELSGSTQTSLQGDATITERGFVVSTQEYPRLSDQKYIVSGTTGDMTYNLIGLSEGTRYYYRAYGINQNGVAYGEHFTLLTTSDAISNNAIVDSNFAACETGEMPTIIGTIPTGGSGTYSYRWLESTDNINWIITKNAGIKKDYTPSTLTVPTYFKRVVISADKIDTSAAKLVPILPETVAGELSSINDSIAPNSSTGEMTLTGNVGDVVLWQRKDGNGTWTIIPNTANLTTFTQIIENEGTYQYRVRVRNGACPQKQTTPITMIVSSLIGLEDIDNNFKEFNIYPNPTNGIFTIDLSVSNLSNVDVQIIDVLGKPVFVKQNLNTKTQINISSIESGTYFVILKDKDKILGKKQIIITR